MASTGLSTLPPPSMGRQLFKSAPKPCSNTTGASALSLPSLNAVWLREGKDKALAPVVLLHGFGADLNSWRPMLGGGSVDNPVLAIDLPGHGESTLSIPESVEAIAGQIEQTIIQHH